MVAERGGIKADEGWIKWIISHILGCDEKEWIVVDGTITIIYCYCVSVMRVVICMSLYLFSQI